MEIPFPDRSLLHGVSLRRFRPWRLPGHGARKQYIALHKNVKPAASQRKNHDRRALNGLAMALS